MLERGQVARHHGVLRAIRPQEMTHQRRNLIAFPGTGGRRVDPVQEIAERRCELAGLMLWRLIEHGLDLQLQWRLPAAGTLQPRMTNPAC